MNIISLKKANAAFEQYNAQLDAEREKLVEEINNAIANITAEDNNIWSMCGFRTNRVVFIDVSMFMEVAVQDVATAFHDAGYACNHWQINQGDDSMSLLAVTWDPKLSEMLYMMADMISENNPYDEVEEDEEEEVDDEEPEVSGEPEDAGVPVEFDLEPMEPVDELPIESTVDAPDEESDEPQPFDVHELNGPAQSEMNTWEE